MTDQPDAGPAGIFSRWTIRSWPTVLPVGGLLLKEELLGGEVKHHGVGILVHHRQLGAACAQVQAPDARGVLDQLDGEL
eukprot:3931857-Pyramimonas_sp.AAC.2